MDKPSRTSDARLPPVKTAVVLHGVARNKIAVVFRNGWRRECGPFYTGLRLELAAPCPLLNQLVGGAQNSSFFPVSVQMHYTESMRINGVCVRGSRHTPSAREGDQTSAPQLAGRRFRAASAAVGCCPNSAWSFPSCRRCQT